MSEEIEPCPFCGGEAIEPNLEDGDCVYWIDHDERCFLKIKEVSTFFDIYLEAWNTRHERTCRSDDGYCSQCGTQLANFFKRYTDEEGFTWGCKPYCPGCGARVTNDD